MPIHTHTQFPRRRGFYTRPRTKGASRRQDVEDVGSIEVHRFINLIDDMSDGLA